MNNLKSESPGMTGLTTAAITAPECLEKVINQETDKGVSKDHIETQTLERQMVMTQTMVTKRDLLDTASGLAFCFRGLLFGACSAAFVVALLLLPKASCFSLFQENV